ncbi:hypothetical protein [Candidatus Magnetominusculus dajiuhuensis]|uniref:hypothetical protein n=1 Tax=Candidatus Magnetominusculus dajiuhuensis TaxID=3137712 RepID=UPI003B43D304
MTEKNDTLFNQYSLSDVLRNNLATAKDYIEGIPPEQFNNSSDDELIEHVYSRQEVSPLELHVDAKEAYIENTKVDTRNYPDQSIDIGHLVEAHARNITISIPFSGEAQLWECQPSLWSSSPPNGTIRKTGHLDIDYSPL